MKTKILFFALIIMLASCSKENDLKKSVMIYDDELTDLPAYTEWGYNTFGAYYDREIFISNDTDIPLKVICQNGETVFNFNGQNNASSWEASDMKMNIRMLNYSPETFTDLLIFNDSIINFKDSTIQIEIVRNSQTYSCPVISGGMHIKRAQELYVDDELIEVILSGYFDFQVLINGEPISISEGRFDFGINNSNFFKL